MGKQYRWERDRDRIGIDMRWKEDNSEDTIIVSICRTVNIGQREYSGEKAVVKILMGIGQIWKQSSDDDSRVVEFVYW